jgi:hypothetical protein
LSIARQQLGLVLSLGCERIVCLAREFGPDLLELQHAAEAAGAHFHAISAPRALVGLVTSADELTAIADGLLADPGEATKLLAAGHAVLVQPVDSGMAAGFERLDINFASAGALRLPGRLVEQLADLSPDIDAVSALTRIALQNGIAQRQIPAAEASAQRWALVRSDDEAHAIEPAWFAERMTASTTASPGNGLARLAAQRFGPTLLHSSGGKLATLVASGVLVLLGLGAGWFGMTATGLGLCGLGWISGRIGEEIDQVERRALLRPDPKIAFGAASGWLLDLALVTISGWGTADAAGNALGQQYFAPAMVVALSRIVPRLIGNGWSRWLEDRALIALVLAGAQAGGFATPTLQGLALAMALFAVALPRSERG